MIRPTKAFTFCIALSTLISSAHAHPTPKGLTTIERNPNTDSYEITHRFPLHDAEEAMQILLSKADLTLASIEGRAQLALHVEEAFQMADAESDQLVTLALVGAQIEGDHILVYQEFTGDLPQRFKVRHDALRDAFPEQVNTLNVKLDSRVYTLVFRDPNKWKALRK